MPSRPKHLDLFSIKLPLPGFVSILHRVSGALLFLALPLLLWLLQQSLRSIETYTRVSELLQSGLLRLVLLGLLWGFLHHLCAGIRYLLIDAHLVSGLAQARSSSWLVLAVSLSLTALFGVRLW
ncbi:succinate dehydrogenase, cytochrome b556 subunit [Ferriphaselus sp. R-1]|uniref:succinate dehydrogenase, cytochrome b556 subunit n=1 Tax=Ferriphaselus sp. R-1 TaxID=1485544 RepID=UPI000551FB23|nr:succinate dehydrogenase, cytochrome b556 subunit [Ferriphaselus sp. R-1]